MPWPPPSGLPRRSTRRLRLSTPCVLTRGTAWATPLTFRTSATVAAGQVGVLVAVDEVGEHHLPLHDDVDVAHDLAEEVVERLRQRRRHDERARHERHAEDDGEDRGHQPPLVLPEGSQRDLAHQVSPRDFIRSMIWAEVGSKSWLTMWPSARNSTRLA